MTFPPILSWWVFYIIKFDFLPSNLRAERETGFFWQKVMWRLREMRRRKCIFYIRILRTCWCPPPQSKINPQLHSKSFQVKGGEDEQSNKQVAEGRISSKRDKNTELWWEGREARRSLTEVRPRLGNPPPPSVHRLSKEKSPWLTVRGDVWGTAAIAVGGLGSFDVQVQ